MSFTDFITKYNGQKVDFDGAYGAQCVDLMNQYLVDVLGISNPIQTLPGATAFQIYQNATDPRFTKIANAPTNVPEGGDLIFWNTTIGSAGHVAIFISGDVNHFVSFDQNWPDGSACHRQDHDYTGVAGWLHCQGQPQSDQQLIDALRTDRDKNWNLYTASQQQVTSLKQQLQGALDQISSLQSQLTQASSSSTKPLEDKIDAATAQLLSLQHDNTVLTSQNQQLNHQIAELTGQVERRESVLQGVIDFIERLKVTG